MANNFTRGFMGDLETTYDQEKDCVRAWVSGLREIAHAGNEYQEGKPIFLNSVEDTFDFLQSLRENTLLWYQNAEYDLSYWMPILHEKGYVQRCVTVKKNALEKAMELANKRNMSNEEREKLSNSFLIHGAVGVYELKRGEYTYSVDDMGKWYYLAIKLNNGYVLEIRDSLKLFPMSIDRIGKETKYKLTSDDFTVNGKTIYTPKEGEELSKGHMDYEAFHAEGEEISKDDAIYLCKDLAIGAKTLQDFIKVFNSGSLNDLPLTIGKSSLEQYYDGLWGLFDSDSLINSLEVMIDSHFPDLSDTSRAETLVPSFVALNSLKQDLSVKHQGNLVKSLIENDGSIDYQMVMDVETRKARCDAEEYQALSKLLPITQDDYIRAGGYKGGWCYVNPKYKGVVIEANDESETENEKKPLTPEEAFNIACQYERGGRIIKIGKMACSVGCTMDVNSLYPYVMSSASGNKYPVGYGTFYQGCIPKWVLDEPEKYCYYVRILVEAVLKERHFPSVQIKDSILYSGTEWLETTYFKDIEGNYYNSYEWQGVQHDTRQMLTLYQTDFELLKENYDLYNMEVLDCLVFEAHNGALFDDYIEKFAKMKIEATQEGNGFKRLMAKLFLNNLYGKMATSRASNCKTFEFDENGALKARTWYSNEKRAGYIAIGAAITANARAYTIRTANANYDWFVYADTDSIHCICPPEKLNDIDIDWDNSGIFGLWKCENTWTQARFLGAKTYFEQMKDDDPVIKACGAPNNCKEVFTLSMPKYQALSDDELYNSERFENLPFDCKCQIKEKRLTGEPYTIEDFDIGLVLHGKLLKQQKKGGCYLKPTTFEIRDRSSRNILKELGVQLDNKKDLRQDNASHATQQTC